MVQPFPSTAGVNLVTPGEYPSPDVPSRVQAAGGVVLRKGKVCVIHRPDYEDWSLPKGKLTAGETHADAALREVHEETGLRCKLGPELSPQEYIDRKGRPKRVRWWAMSVVSDMIEIGRKRVFVLLRGAGHRPHPEPAA